MTPDQALEALNAHIEPGRSEGMGKYHKVPRCYLGVSNSALNNLTKEWRDTLGVDERVTLARGLWQTDIFEARLAAAKLLTQARIRPDDCCWQLIKSWVSDFDSWAIADHACMAGQKRLVACPARVDEVEEWTRSDNHWARRAAMVITLPWTKQNHPKPVDNEIRERVLGWAAVFVQDENWFIQKSVAWWLRDLSKHDPDRVLAFMAAYGKNMKPFARREAEKRLPKTG